MGFDENYMEVRLPLSAAWFEGEEATFDICVDLQRMFKSDQTVDMSKLSNVKFDSGDAHLLANNYASMVSLCPVRKTRQK